MRESVKRIAMGVGLGGLLASAASAAITLPSAVGGLADVEEWAGVILAALAAMWGIRKLVKLTNRS